MKARVVVTLKKSVLDPQGQAVTGPGLAGFSEVKDVRLGKIIELTSRPGSGGGEEAGPGHVREAPRHTVIEEYRWRRSADAVRGGRLPADCTTTSTTWPSTSWAARPAMFWHKDRDLRGADVVVLPGASPTATTCAPARFARFSPIMEEIRKFAHRGGHVIGICNGFQICWRGMLPGAMRRNDSLNTSAATCTSRSRMR